MIEQKDNFLKILRYAIHKRDIYKAVKLSEPVEWGTLLELAEKHHLFPLVHEMINEEENYKEYSGYETSVKKAILAMGQQVRQTEMFLSLYRAFLKEDLHPIVMKGIICRQLYGEYGECRPSGDEDILVKVEDFHKVRKVMELQGFECLMPRVTETQLRQIQDVPFCHKNTGFLIEVHTNLMGHASEQRSKMTSCFQLVFEHAIVWKVKDVDITTMSHTEHYLFLVLHAFKHFLLSGVGIRQVLDILLYQERYEREIDWVMIEEILKENHATKFLGDLQKIGQIYLGFVITKNFPNSDYQLLLEDILEVGVFGKRGTADVLGARLNMNADETKSKGIKKWIRVAFPSMQYMRVGAPHLAGKPWLLPVEWVKRWGRFLRHLKQYDGNLIKDTVENSQKRRELLGKYNQ